MVGLFWVQNYVCTLYVCTFLPGSFFWKKKTPIQTNHLPLKHVQFTHQNKRFVLKQLFQSMFRVCFGPKQFVFVKQQNGVKFFIFFQQFIFFQFQTVDPCDKKTKKKQQKDNATLTNQDTATQFQRPPPYPRGICFFFVGAVQTWQSFPKKQKEIEVCMSTGI